MISNAFDRRAYPADARLTIWPAEDGWPIRRLDMPCSKDGAARGSLLFMGGRADFIEKYLEVMAHWQGQRWNVTGFDWRGQGGSRGATPRGHMASFDPLVADGAAFIRAWVAETPGPHVAVGHSMGGHLLLRVLAEHRPPFAAVVLVAPMIGINASPLPSCIAAFIAAVVARMGWSERPAWREHRRAPEPGSPRQKRLTSCTERYSDELWWFDRQPDYRLGAPTWGWLNAAYRSMAKSSTDALRQIDVPILLVGAERDRLVSSAAIRNAAAAIPGAEIMMIADAAHEILRNSDPVRLHALQRIDAFLDQATR